MSADVNVCVYSTSNLLFRQVLLLQLRLIPKHGDNGNDALSVCMFLAWEWALTAACPSWTIQLTLLTDPPCCHTEAKSSKYIIKTPGEGDFPCQGTKQTNKKKSTDAAKHHSSAPNAHPSRLYLFDPKGQHTLSLWDSVCLVGTDDRTGYKMSILVIQLNVSDPVLVYNTAADPSKLRLLRFYLQI